MKNLLCLLLLCAGCGEDIKSSRARLADSEKRYAEAQSELAKAYFRLGVAAGSVANLRSGGTGLLSSDELFLAALEQEQSVCSNHCLIHRK